MPTLSTLIASGSSVRWICQQCSATGPVDLPRLLAEAGDLDLTDRHPPCRAEGCTYWVGFYAQQGMRNTPLRTHAGELREMRRRSAWLSAKWAAEGLSDRCPHGQTPPTGSAYPARGSRSGT